MDHAIYGKAIENLRNRIDVKLVNNEKYYLKFISKPNNMSHKMTNLHTLECVFWN